MFSKRFVIGFLLFNFFTAGLLLISQLNYTLVSVKNTYALASPSGFMQLEDKGGSNKEKFLILYRLDEGNPNSEIIAGINDNLTVLFDSLDKSYELVEVGSDSPKFTFDAYDAIIINEENLASIPNMNEILAYVKKGGNLILVQRPLISDYFQDIKSLIGIESADQYSVEDSMILLSNVLIKGQGYEFYNAVPTHAIDATLLDECNVLIESENGIPLMWEYPLQQGEVLVANGQFLVERNNRGLLTGLISQLNDAFIYPIINAKVLHLDDYPMPIPQGKADIIYDEYQVDNEQFFYYIWWPDVLKITQRYGLKLNGYLIYNYENDVTDQDVLLHDKSRRERLLLQGENLLKSGGELALHGFNHQPLRVRDYLPDDPARLIYKTWESEEAMVSSLSNLAAYIKEVYPNYAPAAYVSPSNILSEEGRKALKMAFPDLRAICSLYDAGGVESSYEQEFGLGEDGIYDFPRYSSGYQLTEDSKWIILNGLTFNGVFSHFIHPDDVLDPDRNYGGMNWEALSEAFDQFMKYLSSSFGWLKSSSISEATYSLEEYVNSQTYFEYGENEIKGIIKNGHRENYYILKTDRSVQSAQNCKYQLIDTNTYLVSSWTSQFTLKFGE